MTYLVRKITQSKWNQNKILEGAEVSADAITNCSKTTNNTLSTWEIENEHSVDEAVLALASKFDSLDTIDVVILDPQKLKASGLNIAKTKGNTLVSDLVDTHVDIVNMTYKALGSFADCIVESLKKEKVKRYTRTKLKGILQSAIASGRLDVSQIHKDLAAKLK